jgi:heparan-alpha-glucosaminide N-acetyltransferase
MSPEKKVESGVRIAGVDAYRGLVMFLMLGEVLHLSRVARANPDSALWGVLAYHQSHVPWVGCSLHDLIQPSFSFLVGVAMVFSLSNRRARGEAASGMVWHAAWRSVALVSLGIFLRSMGHGQTYFTFEDTLTQIGLGYFFLFLIGQLGERGRWWVLGVLLVGYWLAFAFYPVPGPAFDWSSAGVTPEWEHNLGGFAAHWNKNTNLAWAFDTWFLNIFPRESVFTHNGGGYSTLSFIPTLGTMVLGLIAGGWLRSEISGAAKVRRLVVAGCVGLVAGWLLGALGVCPVVKRIWTPAWTLFSGGWCMLFLAFFYGLMDVLGTRAWAFPLVVVGMNSIAAYCSEWFFVGFIRDALHRHLPGGLFEVFGASYGSLVEGILILLVLWLMLFWMQRRKIFLKI